MHKCDIPRIKHRCVRVITLRYKTGVRVTYLRYKTGVLEYW